MQKEKYPTKSPHEGRWSHLYKLWQLSISSEQLPQYDRWLSQEFAKNSNYGSKDRKWYSEVLFAGIRFCYFALFIENLFKKFSTNQNTISQETLSKEIEEFGQKFKETSSILQGLKQIKSENFFIWICLRYLKTIDNPEIKIDQNKFFNEIEFFNHILPMVLSSKEENFKLIYHSIPLFFEPYLAERSRISQWDNAQVLHFLESFDNRPPLWLRANSLENIPKISQELEKEGFTIEQGSGTTLKTLGLKGVFSTESFRNGLFEIQDLASQRIGEHIKTKPGQFIWDCCAGGGGKTMQIASFLKNKGAIYASDIREYKLEELKKRAKRAGFFNVRCIPWDGTKLPEFSIEIQKNKGFDWILVDAPCSSAGTWRRNPDAKYRILHENITNLFQLQLEILTIAYQALKTGGSIVYSTCSWIYEENEKVVEQFMKETPSAQLISQTLLGSPQENADTMFAAVLKKN